MAFVRYLVAATRKATKMEGRRNPGDVYSAQCYSRNESPKEKYDVQGPLWTFNKTVSVTTLGSKGSAGHSDPDAQISEG